MNYNLNRLARILDEAATGLSLRPQAFFGDTMNWTFKRKIFPLLASALLAALPTALPVHAADKPPTALELMRDIDGVYKERFQSGIVVPGKPDEAYQAENVIEIVPYDDTHVYLRAHLDFYNGHTCDIAGMAGYEHGAFVYHDPTPVQKPERPCALRLHVTDKKLVLTDRETPDAEATCRAYCGARGDLDYEIGREQRRPIRYMERLKKSREYRKALDDLGAIEKQR
jgi:hypothetical protein